MSEDYWKTYGGGVDAGDGTFQYDSYDSGTGDYGVTYE